MHARRVLDNISARNWDMAETDTWLGIAELEAGDKGSGVHHLEEALAITDSCCFGFHYYLPPAAFALARAIADTSMTRARWLAERARDGYTRLGHFKDAERQGVIA